MATETESKVKTKPDVEMDLAGAPCFIERQFPVAKVSMESYKERKANHAQTLTGLGKWWGRKPLVLVRATVLGLLLPATDDPKRDQEVFLKLMTMDDAGMRRRKKDKIDKTLLYQYATDKERGQFFISVEGTWRTDAEIAWTNADNATRERLFSGEPTSDENHIVEGPRKTDTTERGRDVRRLANEAKAALDATVFERMPYSLKLSHCCRPEEISGPDEEAWQDINAHLSTDATSIEQLVERLGMRRFGHRPRLGDSFCGAGSIPFESARMGCDVYASDLSPVAALLTSGALNIVGGGEKVAKRVENVQRRVFEAVDRQITDWGIEHNVLGWRADAFLYCTEVTDPESDWLIPLAPSWIIGERSKAIAELQPDNLRKRFNIRIHEGATKKAVDTARHLGTVKDYRLIAPGATESTPIEILSKRARILGETEFQARPDDVFIDRLYCIRWVETYYEQEIGGKTTELKKLAAESLPDFDEKLSTGEIKRKTRRSYREADDDDRDREARVVSLLESRFSTWQKNGILPVRRVEKGKDINRPTNARGWSHWHHFFNPRQLLTIGLFVDEINKADLTQEELIGCMLGIGRLADWNSKLCRWDPSPANEKGTQTFYKPSLPTPVFNYCARSLTTLERSFLSDVTSTFRRPKQDVELRDARTIETERDFWVTDPPYSDAVNYHELSEYFLAWYDKLIPGVNDQWYSDSKRVLAIKGDDQKLFRSSMVECYQNLTKHTSQDGAHVVMFTHQDAAVWADLSLILWAAGLRVTAAWCIATETDSTLKKGNYVQGTVILICRKRTEDEPVFMDEVSHFVETEVQRQLDEMISLEDDSDPNFGDADYQLAAYAAALRVITERPIEDIDPEKEINRVRPRGEVSPIEEIIRNAVKIACDHLVPKNIDRDMWKTYSPMERFYLKGLEVETHGERRSGVYQELARGFGASNYDDLLANAKANETRLKTATEFAKKMLSGDSPFAGSLTRHVLYAVYTITKTSEVTGGLNWLKTELPNYWDVRTRAIVLLDFFAKLHTVTGMEHWKDDCESASLLAGALRNDHG